MVNCYAVSARTGFGRAQTARRLVQGYFRHCGTSPALDSASVEYL